MSTAGFTLASFLCGAAPNLASLVIFRIIQGATGGALQPLSQAVLLESFKPEERGKAMGFWGLGHRVRADPRPGGRRLAHRELQLALGLLHQPAVRHHLAADDARLRVRSPVPETRLEGHRLLGHGDAGRRHRRAAVRARQGAAGRLVREHDHRGARHRVRRHAHRAHRAAAAVEEPDRRSAAVQGPQLRGGRLPDDGGRLRPLRQPGAPAGDAADPVRVLVVSGGAGDGAARGRLAGDDADGGLAHRADRPAAAAGHRA